MMKNKITKKAILNLIITFLITTQMGFAQSGWVKVLDEPATTMKEICFVPGPDGIWQTGWAVSFDGIIFKTTDGGNNWVTITQTLSSRVFGLSFADESTGYMSTLDHTILKSTDGGLTWNISYSGSAGFDKVAFKDALHGLATGGDKIYTTDGGTNWPAGTGGSSYWNIDYAANDIYYGVNLTGSLGKTTDGGATWANVDDLGEMSFMTEWMDEHNGMFGGDVSKLKITHDGGSSWITKTLGDGQDQINTGGFFDADTLWVCGASGDVFKSTNGGNNWATDTSFSNFTIWGMFVTGMNEIYIMGNSGANAVVWKKVGPPPIGADFEANPSSVCAGSTVDFIDLSYGTIDSWSWTFEGGTPATSTSQNPTVTYNTPGVYDVSLTVTSGGYETSETKMNYINVVLLPNQADLPSGPTSVCTSTTVMYTTNEIQYAEAFDWELNPSVAGTLTWNMNEATLLVSETWAGDFTLRVRATNACGDGEWSNALNGTVYLTPNQFDIAGGGEICEGGPGVEIGLADSETGVNYELYKNEVATGNIVSGTGEAISFGLINEVGNYTAYAYTESCSIVMYGEANITISLLPVQLTMPSGTTEVCNNDVNDYTTTGLQGTDVAVWALSPENAGEINSNGMTATISWNSTFEGTVSLTVFAENSCGVGPTSDALEIMVYAASTPDVIGDNLVCKEEVSVYSTNLNAGNIYAWEVIGGLIINEQGISEITVTWGDTPGIGYVIVNELIESGCLGVDTLVVTIDDCTGIDNNLHSNGFKVYPNPVQSNLKLDFSTNKGENIAISIFNSLGQLVLQKQEIANGEKQTSNFNIESLPKGIYVVTIRTTDQIIWKGKIDKY